MNLVKSKKNPLRWFIPLAVVGLVLGMTVQAQAQDEGVVEVTVVTVKEGVDDLQNSANVVWTCVAAFLVFFMQAGFAMVEAGFTRAKNAVNIIMKNLMDFSVGSIAFFAVGFGLMFGSGSGFVGTDQFAIGLGDARDVASWDWTFLIFQTVFAATAATIVSGAMAERTKFVGYLAYSIAITLVIYPISGHWAWGGLNGNPGWLEAAEGGLLAGWNLPCFYDFAGSTVVHSVGGWLALAGAIVLGPRIGKYGPDKKPKAIVGHNIPLAALGVFILWFGWFGFNPGSTTTAGGDIGFIAVTTNLSAAAGAILAMLTSWVIFKKPEASMSLNGALAGLVAITAPCADVSPVSAIIIGAIAGVLVVLSVLFIDRILHIDDPVGAVSVHGVCGAWGTLSYGIFGMGKGEGQILTQLLGIGAAFVWAFGLGMVLFLAIKYTIGLRVTKEEELQGLDIGEHGLEAYGGFQIFSSM
jgi:ammonium transporter, Amt family